MIGLKGLVVTFVTVTLLASCSPKSGNSAPAEEEVKTEFNYVYSQYKARAESAPVLGEIRVLEIAHEGDEPVALVSLEYDVLGQTVPKRANLLLRSTDEGWQVFDRDLTDLESSTSLNFQGP